MIGDTPKSESAPVRVRHIHLPLLVKMLVLILFVALEPLMVVVAMSMGGAAMMSSHEGPMDTEAVKALLREIVELLESDLTEAMNRLGVLGKHLANSAVREEFRQLEKHVEGFDTDSALKSIETIARSLDIPLP